MQTAEFRMLSTPEAAARLGISASTLAKLRVYGGGPVFTKFRRRVTYHPQDLDSWVAAYRRTSTSDPGNPAEPSGSGNSSRTPLGPSMQSTGLRQPRWE